MTIFGAKCLSKMHEEFKVNESVCMPNTEQQFIITIIKIFENEPKSRRLHGKMFYYYMSVHSDILNYYYAFVKSTRY